MTKDQMCMEQLLCTINAPNEGEPIGLIRMLLIVEGVLRVAYYQDLTNASPEKRQIVTSIKKNGLAFRQELRKLKETDTLMSSDLRSLFRTIREQGHSLCALTLPRKVKVYDIVLGT